MSDVIQLLPDSVANQIAAGEVIQRPASVVKELVENAIDAGATMVEVCVVDAGRTSIQVIDNGKGMSETDARLSFERHSTSKIRQANDLFALRTMGFRGEALASIAAVAQVELRTRMADDEVGTRLCLSGSKVVKQEPTACPVGCNFSVENLFFNVPARRKFLKSNTTELNNIIAAFERIVLVYPDIAFTLHSNDMEIMNLRACNVLQRITDVFGRKMSQDLLPISSDTTVCNISGFVGKPQSARKKGAQQFFFVNGRYMRHPYFNKAVQSAYERLIPTGEQVPYFIYINVNPEDIDVNIHPTKTEIKFENEQVIWQIMLASVREAVGKFSELPSIDFDTQGKPDIPVFGIPQTHAPVMPHVKADPAYNPFDSRQTTRPPREWEKLYEGISHISRPGEQASLFNTDADTTNNEEIRISREDHSPTHYQYKGQYIMTAVKSGLMIIDQHRAHVRILFETYLRQAAERRPVTQKVLFPEVIQLSPAESTVLEQIQTELEAMGFDITSLGGGSYTVGGVPDTLADTDIARTIHDLLANDCDDEEVRKNIALTMARSGAIPYGQVLNNDEMENLVNNLFACENVNYTPDGKTILYILGQEEIEKKLGR